MKICRKCKKEKHESEFHARSNGGPRYQCRECHVEYMNNYYKLNKERQQANQIARYRENPDLQLRRYGLKRGDYDRLLAGQNGRCAICRSETPGGRYGKRFHVDHCHDSKVVRGLLCSKCNCGIGNLRDSAELTLIAHRYLSPRLNILPGY